MEYLKQFIPSTPKNDQFPKALMNSTIKNKLAGFEDQVSESEESDDSENHGN
jgi:hypothetical protein